MSSEKPTNFRPFIVDNDMASGLYIGAKGDRQSLLGAVVGDYGEFMDGQAIDVAQVGHRDVKIGDQEVRAVVLPEGSSTNPAFLLGAMSKILSIEGADNV